MDQLQQSIRSTGGGVQGVEAELKVPDGERINLRINASLVEFRSRQAVLSIHRDITKQKDLERQLAHQALHDRLTGLANRTLFEIHTKQALASAQEDLSDIAILMLDLDRFRPVNESLGHDVGDRLLNSVAERLREVVRQGDIVARVGGDEFTILLENIANMSEVTVVAERILQVLGVPYVLDEHEVVVSASIGIVISTAGFGTPEELIRTADIAMYRAKDGGRGRYVVFDPSMNEMKLARLMLETDLRHGIARDELRVVFQPIVELASEQIVGMEALVRWLHPTRGLIFPIEFISLAEEAGLIRLVDQFVLRASCRQLAQWHEQYPDQQGIVINVNLSAQGFQHPDLVEDVARALAEYAINPSDVQLEITESVIMADAATTHARLRELKNLGVRLAIDDFGTGYSSLSYLKRFPVDTLKIDKSFVDGLGIDAEETAIVEAVISLSQALGLAVIAEGIENEGVTTQLQSLGCLYGQGYHYSKPFVAEAFEDLWASDLRISSGWQPRRTS